MNNIEELKSAYRDVELTARNMRGKPEEYRVVTGFCPVNVVEMQAQKIQALIAQLEASQKELFDFHNQEFQQRLANAEHQLYMKDLAIHNIKASRKAQFRKRLAAEAELSAANEELKGYQLPMFEVEISCGHWLNMGPISGADLSKLPDGINKLFTAPQKPAVLLDKYVRNEKGQYILDGKCEPRIGFAVGWNAAIRAADGKV
ncbi:TPA: hypothetical protein PXP24_001597, partial [Yersinia enterocolitica]|nr:hypothetical protein [Yersinia enterocolitica]